ncbi:hypothetical protein GEMRC1_003411 [Eukaryota sp. GEM-RC1]
MSFSSSNLPLRQRPERVLPAGTKGLRACLWCGLIKTEDQFIDLGCENCDFLNMEGDPDRVAEVTTTSYEGIVSVMNPSTWVSNYLGLERAHPGVYAVHILDVLDEGVYDRNEGTAPFPPRSSVPR